MRLHIPNMQHGERGCAVCGCGWRVGCFCGWCWPEDADSVCTQKMAPQQREQEKQKPQQLTTRIRNSKTVINKRRVSVWVAYAWVYVYWCGCVWAHLCGWLPGSGRWTWSPSVGGCCTLRAVLFGSELRSCVSWTPNAHRSCARKIFKVRSVVVVSCWLFNNSPASGN